MATDSFTYTELGSQHGAFRLLCLKKGAGRCIKCELIHTTFDDHVYPYEAISYTWGSSHKPDAISISGKQLLITLSLSRILRNLRFSTRDRFLWIDAVCIDQSNETEQGHQVQQMAKIYKTARRVLFCIGHPTDETKLLMSMLKKLQNQIVNCRDNDQLFTIWKTIQTQQETKQYALKARLTEGLEHILNQPWWSRVWILQEVANAREAFVYCGKSFVLAEIFAASPDLIKRCQPKSERYESILDNNGRYQPILDLMPGFQRKTASQHNRDLYSLLITFSSAKTTRKQDKIYALLGLCADKPNNTTLDTNYNISDQQIIRNTISYICDCDLRNTSDKIPFKNIEEFLNDLKSPRKNSLLYWAATSGHEAVVRLLLEKGADIEGGKYGAPLARAAEGGHEAVVRLLLEKGVYIERGGYDAPLARAAEGGHEAVVRLLQNYGHAL